MTHSCKGEKKSGITVLSCHIVWKKFSFFAFQLILLVTLFLFCLFIYLISLFTQLALAIADLALQMPSWKGCVQTLVEK